MYKVLWKHRARSQEVSLSSDLIQLNVTNHQDRVVPSALLSPIDHSEYKL